MTSYRVYIRSDIEWTVRKFEADTPQEAAELARQFADEHYDELEFLAYESCDCPINEIAVCDADGNELAVWLDADMRLRVAARDLLDAAEKVTARWECGDLAEAVRELNAAIANATEGAG